MNRGERCVDSPRGIRSALPANNAAKLTFPLAPKHQQIYKLLSKCTRMMTCMQYLKSSRCLCASITYSVAAFGLTKAHDRKGRGTASEAVSRKGKQGWKLLCQQSHRADRREGLGTRSTRGGAAIETVVVCPSPHHIAMKKP